MRTRTPRSTRSRRTTAGLAALGAASLLLLAACGGSSGGDATTSSGAGSGGGTSSGAVVKTRAGDGGQMVLVDAKGRTLYGADQDTSTSVTCTEDCLGFWFPLTTSGSGKPSGDGVPAGKLGTVKRPDNGKTQVTFDGHPLYTFKLDTSAGMTSGDGVSDSFGGTKFSWHTMTTAGLGSSGSSDSGDGDDGGGYGY